MRFVRKTAVDRVADQLTGATQTAVREVLVRRRGPIERAARHLQETHPGLPPRALAERAIARRSELLALQGAVSALPGVMPGLGTAVELGAAIGDITLLTLAQAELVLLVDAIYQRPLVDVEARGLDVLLALGLQAGVVKLRGDGGIEIAGVRYSAPELHGADFERLASRVNRELGSQVLRRLARRRAGVVLGREIPGFGLALAAGFNLRSTRGVGRSAIKLFEHLA